MKDPVAWYDTNADIVTRQYEEVDPRAIHDWCLDLLPEAPATALDIGAGSGRDAAWLASMGLDTVAVEPSAPMRAAGTASHPGTGIQWIDDRLPALPVVTRLSHSYDIILMNAVWMHLPATERPRAFRRIVNLLNPGGLLIMYLRTGPDDHMRGFHPVSTVEVESLARDHGAYVEKQHSSSDMYGREGVGWSGLAIRLPDDGAGALPLLRHVILNDNKSSTYKLALLRTLCRIADGAAGFALDHDDEFIAVPMGLVALTWIRLFKPLLAANLPQSPSNVGLQNLGFVKNAYRELENMISQHDLRVGMTFSGKDAACLHQALKDAVANIGRMPATHITYPNDDRPVFPIIGGQRFRRPYKIRLDQAYLLGFGEMLVPRHLWTTLRRFDVWVEPAIIAEWSKLIRQYALRQNVKVDNLSIATAMTWEDPDRDVKLARNRALLIMNNANLHCIWSGKRLSKRNIDIDHCLPWAAWPCGDLWNQMPAHRNVNRNEKRDRLPADTALRHAQGRMLEWWESAYVKDYPVISERFWLEATSSLPGVRVDHGTLDDIFDAVCFQRLRLKYDQQVPEWPGGEVKSARRG